MCNCLSFLSENPTLQQIWVVWSHTFSLFAKTFQSNRSAEVELNNRAVMETHVNASPNAVLDKHGAADQEDGCIDGLLEKCGIYVIRRRRPPPQNPINNRIFASMAKDNAALCVENGNKHIKSSEQSGEKQERAPVDHRPGQMMKPEHNDKSLLNKQSSHATEIPKKDKQISFQAFSSEKPLINLPRTILTSGGDDTFSLCTQQGLKGTNQDSMVVCENFLPSDIATFCGVFDGHGQHGHHISKKVRDKLPAKIGSCWRALQPSGLLAQRCNSPDRSLVSSDGNLDPDSLSLWEETLHSAFNLMDRDIFFDENIDCVYSGSTALTLVKQGNDLILANVGDSRAVLGVKFEDSVVALQLTVDLTPNLPREADRIRRCKGRVLALRKEPFVKRVWLPHENSPGLAMARAFGDYIVKNFGVISVPEVTHRRISKNDKFVVLATDGVWNVLSNEQVVRIVDAAPVRSMAAQAVVDAAVHAWNVKYPEAKVDDCAVVCMFLNSAQTDSHQAMHSPW